MIQIMMTLCWAAWPHVPIVAMNYYNPSVVFWLQDSELARQTNFLQGVINSALEGVYAGFDVPVADIAGTLLSGDLLTENSENSLPDSIDLVCTWTWMRQFGNIHPNEAGYDAVANALMEVLRTPKIRWCF